MWNNSSLEFGGVLLRPFGATISLVAGVSTFLSIALSLTLSLTLVVVVV